MNRKNKFNLLPIVMGVFLVASATFAKAQDWSQWRGSNRDAVVKKAGLNLDWAEKKPPLLWVFREAGSGYSPPAIVGTTLYCQGAADGSDFAFALDTKTGNLLWKQILGEIYTPKEDRGNGPRGSITVDGDKLYLIRGGGQLHCLSAANGKILWQKDLVKDFGGVMMSGWGYCESPLIDGNLVICTPGGSEGTMMAFDKNTGNVVWRTKKWTDNSGYSSPMVAEIDGVRQYVQQASKGVAGVSAKDGKLLWSVEIDGYRIAVIPTPLILGNTVYVTNAYNVGCRYLRLIKDGDTFQVETIYANRNLVNQQGGVLMMDGYVYGFSDPNDWVCQDLKTGEIVWKQRKETEVGRGAMIGVNDRLILLDEQTGTLASVSASPDGWKEFGRIHIPERSVIETMDNLVWTHPVVGDGKIFLRDHELLFCFDIQEPSNNKCIIIVIAIFAIIAVIIIYLIIKMKMKNSRNKLILSFIFMNVILGMNMTPAKAQDWTQWRGPNREGVVKQTGLNLDWSQKKPSLAWTFRQAGSGYSSPAIVGTTLYCMGADGSDFAFAVDTKSGNLKWKQNLGQQFVEDRGNGPRGSLTVDGDKLYLIRSGGHIHCLSAADGKMLWQKDFRNDFNGKLMSNWGFTESPLIDGNLVICTPGGKEGTMIALDKNTGAVVWRTKEWTDDSGHSSPIVVEIDGVRQYIQQSAKGVAGVAAKDGKLLWRVEIAGYRTAVIPTPIYHDRMVYVTSGYDAGCNLIRLTKAGDIFNAEVVYANKNLVNQHGGVVLVNGYLYGFSDDRTWTCQNLKTGETVWKERNSEVAKGCILAVNDRLLLLNEQNGLLTVAAASPDGWKEFGRMELPERTNVKTQNNAVWAHPVIANGKLYVRDHDLLFCFDLMQ